MVRLISAEQTYALRLEVLRKPSMALDSVQFDSDFDLGAIHLGYFSSNFLLGVASFVPKQLPNQTHLLAKNSYQLRGMATKQSNQNKGIGKEMLVFAHNLLSTFDCDWIWANARTSALGFYKKLGYQIQGNEFNIPSVGPHYVIVRQM